MTCPICQEESEPNIWPYCSGNCLHADPYTGHAKWHRRRLRTFDDRKLGVGGPGGMVPGEIDEHLAWYLAGAQDEAAAATGTDWGNVVPQTPYDRHKSGYVRPKKCGICDFNVLGPVGKHWVWCVRCGAVGNGEDPGVWTAVDPNAVSAEVPSLQVIDGGEDG